MAEKDRGSFGSAESYAKKKRSIAISSTIYSTSGHHTWVTMADLIPQIWDVEKKSFSDESLYFYSIKNILAFQTMIDKMLL